MNWNNFVRQKLDDDLVLLDPRSGIGFSYLMIPDSNEIFGVVGMGKASIFRDIVERNGLMWFEIVEIQKEVLSRTKKVNLDSVLLPYDLVGKRVSRVLLRFLKEKKVFMFGKSMKMREYLEFAPLCDLWVQEIYF